MICPNCGYSHRSDAYADDLAAVYLSPTLKRILNRLVLAGGGLVSDDLLIDSAYAHRDDGGPLSGKWSIHVHITRLRRAIEPHGWTVLNENSRGYKLVRSERMLAA